MVPPDLRASARQRDSTVNALGVAYRRGVVHTGTLELRAAAALRATTVRQLRAIIADLPLVLRFRLLLDELRWAPVATIPSAAAVNLVLSSETRTKLTVGRHPGCEIVFTDPSVSRYHASLRRQAEGWILHDLGSLNGTTVNDALVTRQALAPGDEIAFGDLRARII